MIGVENHKNSVVYTAILGAINDKLRSPSSQVDTTIPFVALMDDEALKCIDANSHNDIWQINKPHFKNNNHRRQARAHKILSHKLFPNCACSLWMDGSIHLVNSNVQHIFDEYLKDADMCVFDHRSRSCISDELTACINQEKDNREIMTRQVEGYFKRNYPQNNGLAETGILLRRHTKAICEFNEMWWNEILKGSYRDQLSFNYVVWQLGLKCNTFPGSVGSNPYFKWHPH